MTSDSVYPELKCHDYIFIYYLYLFTCFSYTDTDECMILYGDDQVNVPKIFLKQTTPPHLPSKNKTKKNKTKNPTKTINPQI